jgi:hypothetical protein
MCMPIEWSGDAHKHGDIGVAGSIDPAVTKIREQRRSHQEERGGQGGGTAAMMVGNGRALFLRGTVIGWCSSGMVLCTPSSGGGARGGGGVYVNTVGPEAMSISNSGAALVDWRGNHGGARDDLVNIRGSIT